MKILAGAGLLLGLWSGPALAQAEPADYNILSEQGDVIRVIFEKLIIDPADDRCDICFKVSSQGLETKTFVLANQYHYRFEGRDPGPRCLTKYLGHDYDSYDTGRNPGLKQGLRGDAFGRRVVRPQNTRWRVDFYKGEGLDHENKVITKMVLFWPGYRITFFWLKDSRELQMHPEKPNWFMDQER